MRALFPILLSLLVPLLSLSAEKLHLRDGRVLEGKIIEVGEREIRLSTTGGFLSIKKSEVVRIERETEPGNSAPPAKKRDTLGDVIQNYHLPVPPPEESTGKVRAIEPETKKEKPAKGPGEGPKETPAGTPEKEVRTPESPPAIEEEKSPPRVKREDQRPESRSGGADPLPEIIKKGKERGKPTLPGALWRSALLPGWGQYYLGHPYRAATTLSLYGTSLGYYGSLTPLQNNLQSSFSDHSAVLYYSALHEGITFNTLQLFWIQRTIQSRGAYHNAVQQSNRTGLVVLGVYLWNFFEVIHIYHSSTTGSTVTLSSSEIRFAYHLRF